MSGLSSWHFLEWSGGFHCVFIGFSRRVRGQLRTVGSRRRGRSTGSSSAEGELFDQSLDQIWRWLAVVYRVVNLIVRLAEWLPMPRSVSKQLEARLQDLRPGWGR